VNVSCPSCETVYRVDPAKAPAGGVRARCAVCSNVFTVAASAVAPQPVGAGVATGGGAPVFTPTTTTPRTPPVPPPPPPPPMAPAAAPPLRRPTPPAPPATPPRAPVGPPVGAPVRPVSAPPVAAPPAAPRAAPPPAAAPPAAPRAAPAAAPPAAPPPAPAPPAPAPLAPARGGAPLQRKTRPLRAVNPFLVQDTNQNARRLSRTLISDMIVYHPEKRRDGMRNG